MADTNGRMPGNSRTPETAVDQIIIDLPIIWQTLIQDSGDFWDSMLKRMWDNSDILTIDHYLNQLDELENMVTDWQNKPVPPEEKKLAIQLVTMRISLAFAIQAKKMQWSDMDRWIFACEAFRFFGMSQGIMSGRFMEKAGKSFAKKGADARHVENRQMKADVFKWADENMAHYSSVEKAAAALAGKFVPVVARTICLWLADWKKIRSAGKL